MDLRSTKKFLSSVEFNKTRESLGIYKHEDMYLRCKGQLGREKLPFDPKLPILPPNSHHFIELVIQSAHEKVCHNGVRETLLELRSKYWILNKCFFCRKLERLQYPSPIVNDLLELRVVGGQAYKVADVDLCRSVYTKVPPKSKEMTKNYISITTCTASRMLHLRIWRDQSTAASLRSQRRFIARQEIPKLIVSDNGKTFKGRD